MNPLFVAAAAVQDLCRQRGWGFCFIGGLAVLRWGEPRLTRDIDLTNRDWLDVEGIAIRQAGKLDGDLVLRELAPLAEIKGSHDAVGRLRALLDASAG